MTKSGGSKKKAGSSKGKKNTSGPSAHAHTAKSEGSASIKHKASSSGAPPVRVRMYRQGLGDCFLITFDVGGDEKHMLIDCGTLGASTTGVKLEQVIADIRSTSNNRLDVVVATHEHWDHISGFSGKTKFADPPKLKVGQVWMAWTENPKDAMAKDLRKYKGDLGAALTAAVAAAPTHHPIAERVGDLLGFIGAGAVLGAKGLAEKVNDAMDFVRKDMGVEAKYKKPGTLIDEQGLIPGFRFYVLGPPRDVAAIKDTGQSGGEELYELRAALGAQARLGSVRRSLADGGRAVDSSAEESDDSQTSVATAEPDAPFDSRYTIRDAEVMRQWYPAYEEPDLQWRSLGDDWLDAASDLALQLDDLTNNTSLALAIERIADGKILLFPADAQKGNWLSWHNAKVTWDVPGAQGASHTVKAADLLRRTVFYKVGHHGSHNATARGKGLELMEHDDLTALIPVDRKVALGRNPKDSWKMPARPLYRRLLEKCQGRVVRSDIGWADDAQNAKDKKTEKEFIDLAKPAEWKKWKTAQQSAETSGMVKVSALHVDYVLR